MNALAAFFLGQLTLALLIFAFIKFFIFGEPPPPSHTSRKQESEPFLRSPLSTQRLRHKQSSALRAQPPTTTASILAKTYYNVSGHQPESLDWFNVLVAQTIAQLRADAQHDGAILKTLTDVLNGPQRPDFVGEIKVTEVNLGEEYPIFSNCRIIPVEERDAVAGDSRLQARLDVDLSDGITLGVETKLVLNYPKPNSAVLPVALAVSVVRFSGTVRSYFCIHFFHQILTTSYRSFLFHLYRQQYLQPRNQRVQLVSRQPWHSHSSQTTASIYQSVPW
jgi:maintenance of morphology protein 1